VKKGSAGMPRTLLKRMIPLQRLSNENDG
jgi:hypothetical protein